MKKLHQEKQKEESAQARIADQDEDEDLFDLIDDFFLIVDKCTKRVSKQEF